MTIIRIILAMVMAFAFGRIVVRAKLPAILGWLMAGMIMGPYLLNIMSQEILDKSTVTLFANLMETFAGIVIGSELIYNDLKKFGKNIAVMTLFQSIFTLIFVSFIFAIVLYVMKLPLYLSIVFGGIALATAPAPSIAIVKQYGAKGPVTNTLIPMAVLDDLVAIVIFFTTISIIRANLNGQGIQIPLYY